MSSLVRFVIKLSDFLKLNLFGFNKFEPILVPNMMPSMPSDERRYDSIIDDIMRNGFVWATQKKRRTVERRLQRRFGHDKYPDSSRMIRPKQNITVCDVCGHYHEMHTLCGHCYDKVRDETQLIQEEMRTAWKSFEPIEQEVGLRYRNEANDESLHSSSTRIVEIDRERPEWFAKNLLSKTISSSNKWSEKNVIVRQEEPQIKD